MMAAAGRSAVVSAAVMLAACRPAAAAPLAVHIHSERAMFQLPISPGTVGADDFVLMSGEGNLLPVKEATLVLSLPGRGIEPLERNATLGADGYWHLTGVPLPQAGRWHLRVVAVTAFQKITLEDDFEVPLP
jgi:copper transport protein